MKNLKLKHNQQGVALAVGMILLLIISIIGVTSMKSAILQEKMAGGLKNRELADSASLSLLVEIEKYIYTLYQESNSTVVGVGGQYMLAPRSAEAEYFKTVRTLDSTSGFTLDSKSINSEYGGVLQTEPRFIIEPTHDLAASSSGSTPYGTTEAEADDGSAGDASGGGTGITSKFYTYRIVSKATDTTGHVISAFESVMSVKTR